MVKRLNGFTLIELLVVIAIIGILFGIGIPNYQEYARKGKRAEATVQLLQSAAQLERIFTETNSYQNVNQAVPTKTQSGYYSLAFALRNVNGGTNNGYTLTATPNFTDKHCGNFTLDESGNRGCTGDYCSSGTTRCW